MDLTGRNKHSYPGMGGSLFYPQTPRSSISLENEYYFSNPNTPMRPEVKVSGYAKNRCYGASSLSVPNRKWLEHKDVNQISPSTLRAGTLQREVLRAGPPPRVFGNQIENIPPNKPPSRASRRRSRHHVHETLKDVKDYGALEAQQWIGIPANDLVFGWNQHEDQISWPEGRGIEGFLCPSRSTTGEAASRASDSIDLASGDMIYPGIERTEVLAAMPEYVLRYRPLGIGSQHSDDVFQDNRSPVESPTTVARAGHPSAGFHKRRHSSASLPDKKRIRSPTKSSAPLFRLNHSSDSSSCSPRRTIKPRSEPRLANRKQLVEEEYHTDDCSYDADSSSLDGRGPEKVVFPGDSPYRGGIRRQEPVDRRFNTSPRTLIRIFANVKELTNRVREGAILVKDQCKPYEVSSAYRDDFGVPQLYHPQPTVDGVLHHQLLKLGFISAPERDSHSYIRSYGCAPSRPKAPPPGQRARSGSGCHSSATASERGFIGGYKLMRRLQGFSDSDSDKDRRFQRINSPKTKETPPRSETGENEENEGVELVKVGPSSAANQPSLDGSAEKHAADGCDIRARGEALDSDDRGPELHNEERSGRSGNAGPVVEARMLNRSSDSTAVEPLTPVDGSLPGAQALGNNEERTLPARV